MKVVLAFSGGLDTCFSLSWLKEEKKAEVITVFVDTGGVGREAREAIAERAKALGAVEHIEKDARETLYNEYISTLIRGNVLRGEVYPLSVAAERTVQAMEVARVAREKGAHAVAHGSTGAGNDQVRFDTAFRVLLDIPIITPVRDMGIRRKHAISFLRQRGFEVPGETRRHSINRGMWGTTLGGEWTHDSWAGPPHDEFGFNEKGEEREPGKREITIGWEKGLPVSMDGKPMNGPDLVLALSEILEPYKIGWGIHVGETVIGIKGRIGFMAGAAIVLIHAHRELEKIVLTKWQAFWKDHLARFFGDRLHEGQAFDPVMKDIRALIESSQERVEGETRILLSKGRFLVTGTRSPWSLMESGLAKYGEEQLFWTGEEARAFAKLGAIPSVIYRMKGRDRER